MTARVWERGVGETQSSGTSAVAIAAATTRRGHDGRALPRRRARRSRSPAAERRSGARWSASPADALPHPQGLYAITGIGSGFPGLEQRLQAAEDQGHAARDLPERRRFSSSNPSWTTVSLQSSSPTGLDLPGDPRRGIGRYVLVPAGVERHRQARGRNGLQHLPRDRRLSLDEVLVVGALRPVRFDGAREVVLLA